MKRLILPQSLRKRVNGLRDFAPPSAVRVYSAKTKKLLRVEKPEGFEEEKKNWGRLSL